MKKFIETIRNIWKIEDLRGRIMITLGLILIYRIGSYVVLPGVDVDEMMKLNDHYMKGRVDIRIKKTRFSMITVRL